MKKLTPQEVKTIIQNAPQGSNPNTIVEALMQKGYILEGLNDQPKPEKEGFLKTIGKDVAETLLVKPADRFAEAVGRTGILGEDIKKGYETMSDEGQSRQFDIPVLGKIDVEAQKGGAEGNRQIAGEALKIGSFLFPYGRVAKAVGGTALGASKLTPTAIKTAKTIGNVASGVSGGYMADVGYNLADDEKTLGESFIPGLGTVLGGAIPVTGTLAKAGRKAIKGSKTATDVTKRVIQGETSDIPLAEQAFKNLDLKGVKTRQELSQKLSDAMENQMKIVDQELAKDPRALSLDDYAIRVKNNAGQEVKTDVISNALTHLEDFYKQSGDNLSASNINLIKQKAISEGLTHQEVNNIARMYSSEFGSKAFNKMGDPLTSVNAQMFENTRSGLKQASRGGLGFGEEAKQADKLYSAMSNTKRLIDKGVEGVNKLEARLKNRNILQKLSYGAVKVINALTGGILKSAVEALGVSNVGNKIDNWVNLERSLKKDLEFIQKANTIKTDSALIKFIENSYKGLKFPGDAFLDTKTGKKVINYAKNPKVGMSIEDVSKKSLKGNNSLEKAKIDFEIKLRKTSPGQPESWYKFQLENQPFVKNPEKFGLKGKGGIPTTKSVKAIDDATKRELQEAIDYIDFERVEKVNQKIEENIGLLAEKFGITTKNYKTLANQFEKLINKTKTIGGERKVLTPIYKGEKDLTTKILKDLEGKSTVSKQYILDATNRGELKQVERDLVRNILKGEKDTINVSDFAKKVKAELLPLKVTSTGKLNKANWESMGAPRYENISLPSEVRGKVKDYTENIYESPIKTSAGSVHFSNVNSNYFGHTRIEDMADNKTRRVIEVQSDLYQKGNLEKKVEGDLPFYDMTKQKNIQKLSQYNDPTAHFRMIREEIKKASQDGKTKLQFPTGETALKIEGLGETNNWYVPGKGFGNYEKLTPDNLKVGATIETDAGQGLGTTGSDWIITDVLGDGKFKAVPKAVMERANRRMSDGTSLEKTIDELLKELKNDSSIEQFDISGKVDTNNPIYKFYEKDVQHYLKKFGGKRVVDDNGVEWIEVPIKKEWAKMPVEAFAIIGGIGLATKQK